MKVDTIKLALNQGIDQTRLIQYLEKNYTVLEIEPNLYVLDNKEQKSIQLKEKEHIIVDYITKGMTYKEISDELGMSIDGVRYYIKRIYKKMGVHNSRQAINNYLAES